jgi:hypothetical protein
VGGCVQAAARNGRKGECSLLIYDVILDVGTTGCQQNVSFYQGDDLFRLQRITLLQNVSF